MHRIFRTRFITLLVALAVGALVAGCGGGDDQTVTKAEFVKRAEAICEKGVAERKASLRAAISKALSEPQSVSPQVAQEKLAKIGAEVALPPLRTIDSELDAIGLPQGGEEEVEAILSAIEAGIQRAAADPGTLLNEYDKLFLEARKLAKEFGLKACAVI